MDEEKRLKTLGDHFKASLRRQNANRPVSFYLLFAIIVVVLLGAQIVYVKDDPWKFAFFLTLNFVFFGVVIFRATLDCFEIARRAFREREELYHHTLGDTDFVHELGARVDKARQKTV